MRPHDTHETEATVAVLQAARFIVGPIRRQHVASRQRGLPDSAILDRSRSESKTGFLGLPIRLRDAVE